MRQDPVHEVGGASLIHTTRKGDAAAPHSHKEVMLFLPVRGIVLFDVIHDHTKESFACTPRDIFCVMPGVTHAHTSDTQSVEYLVVFLPATSISAPTVMAWTFTQTLFLRECAAQLCAEASHTSHDAHDMANACTTILALAAQRGAIRTAPDDPWRPLPEDVRIAAAMTYARAHFAHAPSIELLARAAGMSRRSLERAFKHTLGTTPRQYIEALRMHEARARLHTTQDSVTEIAFDLGYKDLSHFIRTFQSIHGQSPTELRALSL